ncbi:hypothetical protein [Streptomyces sp. NPDC048659]|uniref:hypothetical protein n=1 Tax=Streptomyces sp. NPDC048659 TaxID=3155489 RepID=UPI00344926E1
MEQVASWLVWGIERRRASVCAPAWLRLAQAGRPFFPGAVDLLSRREIPQLLAGRGRREPSRAGALSAGSGARRLLMSVREVPRGSQAAILSGDAP